MYNVKCIMLNVKLWFDGVGLGLVKLIGRGEFN